MQLGEVHGGVGWAEWPFDLTLFATEPLDSESSPVNRQYVTWRLADVQQLFGTIQGWWENWGRKRAQEIRGVGWRRAFDGATFHGFVNRLWDVMRMVIIPRMRHDSSLVTSVTGLIEEMRAAGVPVGSVLPATLMVQPDSLHEVASRLRQEFANPEADFHLSALRGVFYLMERSTGNRRRRAVHPRPMYRSTCCETSALMHCAPDSLVGTVF